jgi:hypothetical protein
MRLVAIFAAVLACSAGAGAQQLSQSQSQPPQPAAAATPQMETVGAPQPAAGAVEGEGYLTQQQVKELLQKVWLAEYRMGDLLTEVRPERWNLADPARASFQQTLQTLRTQLAALDGWRTRLEMCPENAYLGYMTYGAMNAVLPRLDAVARSITEHENASLGAQFSQAGNQLFDLQQALSLYVSALLRSQDEIMQALRNNLASCQNELGYALGARPVTAKPVTNILSKHKRRPSSRASGKANLAPAPKQPATTASPKPAPQKP